MKDLRSADVVEYVNYLIPRRFGRRAGRFLGRRGGIQSPAGTPGGLVAWKLGKTLSSRSGNPPIACSLLS